jgi:hypothetical protein
VKCEIKICFTVWISERERNVPAERVTDSSEKRGNIANVRLRRLLIALPSSVCVTVVNSCWRARGLVAEDGCHISLVVPSGSAEQGSRVSGATEKASDVLTFRPCPGSRLWRRWR